MKKFMRSVPCLPGVPHFRRIASLRRTFNSWMALALALSIATACDWHDRVAPIDTSSELVVAVRASPISFTLDADERSFAYEQALIEKLAEHLGLSLRFLPVGSDREVVDLLLAGKAHLGAGWLAPPEDPRLASTPPFHFDDIVLIHHESWLPLEDLDALSGKTIHLPQGSRLVPLIAGLRARRLPSLTIIERPDADGTALLEAVAGQSIEYSAASRQQYFVAQTHLPELQSSLALHPLQPIVWLLPNEPGVVHQKIAAFITAMHVDGSLERMRDAHFSFRRRLTRQDTAEFIERIDSRLPRYAEMFRQAQISTGFDWRLLAALAYQESQWDPLATSPTNVRGMMMLTEETADRLRVTNRLDAAQSIRAGSRYLAILRDELPMNVPEPDRTWLALAAYNLGMGHLNGGRAIAKGRNANPDSWFEMKKVLPLLTRPEVYERLKSGRARGGEAVILVENIRAYYDILVRLRPPFVPLPEPETTKIAAKNTLRQLRSDRALERPFRP
jgi:membrane-bound lytic murein transglycosylase F